MQALQDITGYLYAGHFDFDQLREEVRREQDKAMREEEPKAVKVTQAKSAMDSDAKFAERKDMINQLAGEANRLKDHQ